MEQVGQRYPAEVTWCVSMWPLRLVRYWVEYEQSEQRQEPSDSSFNTFESTCASKSSNSKVSATSLESGLVGLKRIFGFKKFPTVGTVVSLTLRLEVFCLNVVLDIG